jgi:class 3 adenylate cyclase
MLPRKIANNLKMGRSTPAEHFEEVTIYFSDIIDFTTLGASSEPMEIVFLTLYF